MLEMKKNSNKLEKVNESEVKLIIPDMVKNIMNHFEKYPTAKKFLTNLKALTLIRVGVFEILACINSAQTI